MDKRNIIEEAMDHRSSVSFIYNGYERHVTPYVLGYKNGKLNLLGYQYGGFSSSGQINDDSPKNFRCFFVNNISNIKILEKEKFWPKSYKPKNQQTCIDRPIKIVEK